MQSRIDEIRAQGAELFAISVDSPEENLRVVKKSKLSYSILSDPQGKVIDTFGVRHKGAGMEGGDIARPAAFILDEQGKIVWRKIATDVRIRVRPGQIIEELQRLRSR